MGQYYKPTALDKNADVTANDWQPIKWQLLCYDFDELAKLMEHSYVGNYLVQAVEYLLSKDKEGVKFAWCGDYAEDYPGFTTNLFDIGDQQESCKEGFAELVKDGVLTDFKGLLDKTCYRIASPKTYKYVINHTKKMYVEIPPQRAGELTIHPLPLLTCESNGLGGGDYYAEKGKEYVGAWKYDRISVGDEVPDNFEKLDVIFEE